MSREYYVHILPSKSRTLYIGVTNDLERRVWEHKQKEAPGFTARYGVTSLVYYESFGEVTRAIAREKELKAWRREKTVALLEATNPQWQDLAADWYWVPPSLQGEKGDG